jgi:hypothetical protein
MASSVMRNILPGSEQDMWWNWTVAELDSTRFGDAFRYWIPPDLQTKIRMDRREALTDIEWDRLKAAVISVRFPILLDLLLLGIVWHTGDLDPSDLPDVRIMNYDPHVKLAPSRTLVDFAAALDDNGNPPGEEGFGDNYRKARDTFRIYKVRGRPILVAETKSGPFTMLEGYTRLTVMTSLWKAGEFDSESIPILLGVCARLKEWRQFVCWNGQLVRTPKSFW